MPQLISRGVEAFLADPFNVNPNMANKHGIAALWLAARDRFNEALFRPKQILSLN
jgi:hypothetical protein